MSKFNYEQFEEQLEILLAQDRIERWEGFGPGHYRVNGILDIWPRRKKYFYLYTKYHGVYKDLETLIDSIS